MDSIKKKMEKLASETAEAEYRIAHFEELKAANELEAEKYEEQVRNIQKKMQSMEGQFDGCTEDLFNQSIKLEEMEKKAGNAEGEVSGLRSRLILLQENTEKQEERLAKATLELAGACFRADTSVRKRHELENGVSSNEESIDSLERQLHDAQFMHGESERKYEDIYRKLATLEADAARGNERADGAEKKIRDLEEELTVVGKNLQLLEVGEEQTRIREEKLQIQILELRNKLKGIEYRGEQAEMNIQRLNVRIDQVEEDLLQEKLKIKKVSDELDQTFDDMLNLAV
ncbi:tropomyosin isoform X2 [Eurytemora carolleeae]|uniref:tropomyosin isoform X1 n=1 Tax=Eurytemora carolleeae TaxID=1294199 RepID=UPI000C793596|nr:tropomyosin isoform X1 [Eurytemora carolleeae]XP_023334592.1 tropomyosin isoform X1 [Eurytemora carolleeae]XP_023334593.1 tropomyosin isoform X1 [Eurytemora carolleeae]XP_023334594.1 tropomyosin isoform X1 [Eurytemora carolleeae]XP_023334595.1 tropomyosin isoform X1 [Eurytemora carolleeae]XP_023334596.1 tropomyosin isoform X2 [Eurytemora carolleeae]|eukprot:XP_023334591.1 tropomyosin-like isoform X1 [Eurytemora affinis]